jgi:hypothetical protein
MLTIILILASSFAAYSNGINKEPLTQDELVALITTSKMGAVSPDQVVKIINQRGLGFRVKELFLLELRERKASDFIIAAVQAKSLHRDKPSPDNQGPPKIEPPSLISGERRLPRIKLPNNMNWVDFLSSVRSKAMEYTDNLPNFICTQITQRFLRRLPKKGWIRADNFVAELTYYDQTEHYKLLSVANRAAKTDATLESLGGTFSTGEFGSTLNYLFNPETKAVFRLEGVEKNQKSTAVRIGFKVPLDRSKRQIIFKSKDSEQSVVTGYRGRCWIDSDSLQVIRIKEKAFKIPSDFPITRSEGGTVYDEVEIAGLKYWLPVRAEVLLENGTAKLHTKNVIEFKRYRKFGSDVKFLSD